MVSHEIRTPLSAILSAANVLLRYGNKRPESVERFAKVIHQEGRRLTRLINNLLDLAKIEAGQVEWSFAPDGRGRAGARGAGVVRRRSSASATSVSRCEPWHEPVVVELDRDKITQVLVNLVSNSIKHSPDGGTVRLRYRPWRDGGVRLEVEDEGAGIPAGTEEQIFERFEQLGNRRGAGGDGAGADDRSPDRGAPRRPDLGRGGPGARRAVRGRAAGRKAGSRGAMVQFDNQYRQVKLKVVYYGPGLCGKTTCLQYIHRVTDPQRRTKLYTLNTASDRTLFFDLLGLDLGRVRGYRLTLQLYTVPGQVQYNATRRAVLGGLRRRGVRRRLAARAGASERGEPRQPDGEPERQRARPRHGPDRPELQQARPPRRALAGRARQEPQRPRLRGVRDRGDHGRRGRRGVLRDRPGHRARRWPTGWACRPSPTRSTAWWRT